MWFSHVGFPSFGIDLLIFVVFPCWFPSFGIDLLIFVVFPCWFSQFWYRPFDFLWFSHVGVPGFGIDLLIFVVFPCWFGQAVAQCGPNPVA